MTIIRRGRFFYWILRDLFARYTKALILGFVSGFLLSISFIRALPFISYTFFTPISYVGVVGDYSPEKLPLSIQKLISNGLTTMDTNGEVVPALASSWESTDSGKIYIFHIKDDIVWHNGNKLTARDINYNIRDVVFTVEDEKTLKATLNTPFSPFPSLLSKPVFLQGLIGTGQMKVTKIKLKGDKIVQLRLTPADKSNRTRTIEYRFYTTEAQAAMAFKLGEIDVIDDLSSPGSLNNWGSALITEKNMPYRIITLFFNTSNQYLGEKKHRQGLGYALPEFALNKAISPISEDSWAFSDRVRKFRADSTLAARLLDINKSSTQSARLTLTTFPAYADDANAIAASWSALGIKTDVRIENSLPNEYEVLLSALDVPPDPDQYAFWHSTQMSTNITKYINVKIDKLLEDGRRIADLQKRKQIYTDFQRYLVDDAPAIFLYYPVSYTVTRK